MSGVATTLNVREMRHNAGLIAVLTVVGLPLAVAVPGPSPSALPVALLFAATVLSLFEEFDIAERPAITIEGESLFSDGVAIASLLVQGPLVPTALDLTGPASGEEI